jgi:hypothetical protein
MRRPHYLDGDEKRADAIRRAVDAAPPLTEAAADLLRRLDCPAGQSRADLDREAS